MSGLTVITEPTQEPLSLQEVKDYLRVEDSTDERTIRPSNSFLIQYLIIYHYKKASQPVLILTTIETILL